MAHHRVLHTWKVPQKKRKLKLQVSMSMMKKGRERGHFTMAFIKIAGPLETEEHSND